MSTRAQLLAAVQTDFPTNNAREITAEVLRDFLDDYIDSVWIPETDGTPATVSGNTLTIGTAQVVGGASKTLTFNSTMTLVAGADGRTFTFPSTSATIARTDAAQTFTGTQTFATILGNNGTSGRLTLTGTFPGLVLDTSDASDTKSLTFAGGGDNSDARGAVVTLYGNEHATRPGRLELGAGNVTGNRIDLLTGGAVQLSLTSSSGNSTLTGGAGNMTITAGTGNSRTLALQSTTSGGVATTFLTGNADQSISAAAAFTAAGIIGSTATSGTNTFNTDIQIANGASGHGHLVGPSTAGKDLRLVAGNTTGGVSVRNSALTQIAYFTDTAVSIASISTFAVNNTTEATTGGAGSLTTAGGIYATKKIIGGSLIQTYNTATGDAGFTVQRTGGTAALWNIYSPSGTANLVFDEGGVSRLAITSSTGQLNVGASGANALMVLGAAAPSANNTGRLSFLTSNTAYNWRISTNDNIAGVMEFLPTTTAGGTTYSATNVLGLYGLGNVRVGVPGATTMTDGFLYVPSVAGTPTGVPTAITNFIPIVADRTNNKLYIYSGGAWVALN